MAKAATAGHTTDWDRDAALTTARILLEIKAINFRPEEPYTFTSGWKSPVYIDCRRIIYFPRARTKICELGGGEDRPPRRLRDDRGGGGRRDRRHPVRRLDRRPDGGADGLCAQEAQGLRPQRADRGRRAGGQAHAAGRGPDHRRPVEDPLRAGAARRRRDRQPRLRRVLLRRVPRRVRDAGAHGHRSCTICALGGTCWRPARTGRISPRPRWPRCGGSWRTRSAGRPRMAALHRPKRRWQERRRPRPEPHGTRQQQASHREESA